MEPPTELDHVDACELAVPRIANRVVLPAGDVSKQEYLGVAEKFGRHRDNTTRLVYDATAQGKIE